MCVKRESGESPEQSRCCKLFIPQLSSGVPPLVKTDATVRRDSRMGRRRAVGSKSEDLPNHDFKAFEERAEKLRHGIG